MFHKVECNANKVYIDDLINSLGNGDTILLNKGNYYLKTSVKILNKNNITIRGVTGNPNDVSITQEGSATNSNNDTIYLDGIAISNSEYITIDSITLIVDRDNGTPVCLSVNGSSNVHVTNSRFYCSSNAFAIYFSGPTNIKQFDETLNAYYCNELSSNNVFEKNLVYSKFEHDGVVFSLQSNGILRNNIVFGCRFAVYMVRDTLVHGNYSYDSISNGITCSMPCYKLNVSNNIVKRSIATGIRLMTQGEHGKTQTDDFEIKINDNKVDSCLNGLDVVDCKNVLVSGNKVSNCKDNGITTVNVDNCKIHSNTIVNCKFGITISCKTYNTIVCDNTIYNYKNFPQITSNNGIKIEMDTGDNHVHDNQINVFNPNYSDINHLIIDYNAINLERNISTSKPKPSIPKVKIPKTKPPKRLKVPGLPPSDVSSNVSKIKPKVTRTSKWGITNNSNDSNDSNNSNNSNSNDSNSIYDDSDGSSSEYSHNEDNERSLIGPNIIENNTVNNAFDFYDHLIILDNLA